MSSIQRQHEREEKIVLGLKIKIDRGLRYFASMADFIHGCFQIAFREKKPWRLQRYSESFDASRDFFFLGRLIMSVLRYQYPFPENIQTACLF